MMFDIRGNLTPAKKIQVTLEEFKEVFVDSFSGNSSRHELFKNYEDYLENFKQEVTPNFRQWIDGSFVTRKINPRDMDFVSLVDYQVAEDKYEIIKDKFINKSALSHFKIDAYILKIYPKCHQEYSKTVSDLLYWEHWFGYTRKNRAKKRFAKGFIEIVFDK